MAATCDDCGENAEIIVVNLLDDEADALCWADMVRRMMPIIAQAASDALDAAESGAAEPSASR